MKENLTFLREMFANDVFAPHILNTSMFGFWGIRAREGAWPNILLETTTGNGKLEALVANWNQQVSSGLLLLEEHGVTATNNTSNILRPVTRWCDMILHLPPQPNDRYEVDSDLTIRKVDSEKDLMFWIKLVETELFQNKALSGALFMDMLRSDFFDFFLFEHCNVFKGAAMTFNNSDDSRGLYFFVVPKCFQRSGLGRLFLEQIVMMSKLSGANSINLQSTVAGLKLYERMGFQKTNSYFLYPLRLSN